jgi:Type II secretion system protein B
MSYILQALKKAEEQRGASPRAVPTPRALPPASRPRWPWIAGGLVGLAGIAGVVALRMLGPVTTDAPARTAAVPDPPVSAVTPSVTRSEPVPAEPAAPAPRATAPRPESERAGARAATRAPVTRGPSAPERTVAAVTAPSPARPAAETIAPTVPVTRPRSETITPPPAAQPDRAVPSRTGGPQLSGASGPAPAVAGALPPPAPAAPAGELKALAARLSLQVLSWAPDPNDRFVFVNGRKYREGQAIDDRFLIERIADDSVVISYQGERVTLKGP